MNRIPNILFCTLFFSTIGMALDSSRGVQIDFSNDTDAQTKYIARALLSRDFEDGIAKSLTSDHAGENAICADDYISEEAARAGAQRLKNVLGHAKGVKEITVGCVH